MLNSKNPLIMTFPTNPTIGQEYRPSDNHPTYVWNGYAWRAVSSQAISNKFYYQDTVPTDNLENGTLWFNTENGNTYAYAYDGELYEWIQINA